MELFNVIANVCSILGFVVAVFATTKIISVQKVIKKNVKMDVRGDRNISAGNDVNIRK
jgi:hypothetical protein